MQKVPGELECDLTETEVIFFDSLEDFTVKVEVEEIESEYLLVLAVSDDQSSFHKSEDELMEEVFFDSHWDYLNRQPLNKRETKINELLDEALEREYLGEENAIYLRNGESYAVRWLAKHMGVNAHLLSEIILSLRSGKQLYSVYYKKKRGGKGKRKIVVPRDDVKRILRKVNSSILNLPKSVHAFGFSGGSTREALEPHVASASILSIDIRNAFPTITHELIIRLLCNERYSSEVPRGPELSWYASCIIADLGTHERLLAQGSPTSPRIFDMICANMDRNLAKLAENVGGVYTRYADNIFFSVSNARLDGKLRRAICRQIWQAHNRYPQPRFWTHKLKIKTLTGNSFHALGLVIRDGRLCNTRDFKRRLRKALHHVRCLLESGDADLQENHLANAWSKLAGMFSYAQKDSLPQRMLDEFCELQHKVNKL